MGNDHINIITITIALAGLALSIINSVSLCKERKRLTRIYLSLNIIGYYKFDNGKEGNAVSLQITTNSTINYFITSITCNKFLSIENDGSFILNNSSPFSMVLEDGGIFNETLSKRIKLTFTLQAKNIKKPITKTAIINKLKT